MFPDPIFLNVHWYGVMIAIGLLCCFGFIFISFKKKKIEDRFTDFVFYNGVIAIAIGFVSAAIFQSFYDGTTGKMFEAFFKFIQNPQAGFNFNLRITFIGGLIGGAGCFLLIYLLFRKKYKNKLIDVLSIIPCAILVAHGFGRVGCFCAGCCHGMKTDSIWGVKFPNLPDPVYPTQLYEAIFLFILFGVCTFLLFKYDFKHNLSVYLIGYGIFRFLNEFLRGDNRGDLVQGISPSQFWSILMVVLGVGLVFLMNWLLKRRNAQLLLEQNEESSSQDSETPESVVEDETSQEMKKEDNE